MMEAGGMPQLTQLMQRGVLAATHLLLLVCLVKGLWLAAAAAVAAVAAAKYAKQHLAKRYRLSLRQLLLLQLCALLLSALLAAMQWQHQTVAAAPLSAAPVTSATAPSAVGDRESTKKHSPLRRASVASTSSPAPPPQHSQQQQQQRQRQQLQVFRSKEEHPDLRRLSSQQIREKFPVLFRELPEAWDSRYRNPCWADRRSQNLLQCLPYAYILGMPKCGTTDLWGRLVQHRDVAQSNRKEIRWFTRGEFADDDDYSMKWNPQESIRTFTRHLTGAVRKIQERPDTIVVDGGPHTLWWPVQSPSGKQTDDVPPPQLLYEMQPDAKFIITLRDPVHRMYSDYYFLADDKTVARDEGNKSAAQFHKRVVSQINEMQECIQQHATSNDWITASQICAHDRYRFGRAGWGRLNIGMYIVFINKWLEIFKREQFLILRLEDYGSDPKAHMRAMFDFLELPEPSESEWQSILRGERRNQMSRPKDPMLPETEKLLREFYQPYNDLLAQFMSSDRFAWRDILPPPAEQRQHVENDEANEAIEARDGGEPDQERPEDNHDQAEELSPSTDPVEAKFLQLRPAAFSIDGLPGPLRPQKQWNRFAASISLDVQNMHVASAGAALCSATSSLELGAIKYFLYDRGVSIQSKHQPTNRTALHCLAVTWLLTESFPGSFAFSLLKGQRSWVSEMLELPLPTHTSNVYSKTVLANLQTPVRRAGEWLVAAGVDVNAFDGDGYTALMLAAQGGLDDLVSLLLENGADPNARGPNNVTALQLAAIFGQAASARMLLEHGASRADRGYFGVSFDDIVGAPGAMRVADAHRLFGIAQRSPLHLPPPSTTRHGGWSTKRLAGFEGFERCDVDMLQASEIDADSMFRNYIAQAKPVLIRGLIDDWPAFQAFTFNNLMLQRGELDVHVSAIPYARKFDSNKAHEGVDMTLAEYLKLMKSKSSLHGSTDDGASRWYLFKPFRIPELSEADGSPVSQQVMPAPKLLMDAFSKMAAYSHRIRPADARLEGHARLFVNAQWAIGGAGTGAPVHYHNTAWNALVYGAKLWYIYPPAERIMSNDQILAFVMNEVPKQRGSAEAMQCVQQAGDVMIIPESWAHGVLNLQDSVAVATEVRGSFHRVAESLATKPSTQLPRL